MLEAAANAAKAGEHEKCSNTPERLKARNSTDACKACEHLTARMHPMGHWQMEQWPNGIVKTCQQPISISTMPIGRGSQARIINNGKKAPRYTFVRSTQPKESLETRQQLQADTLIYEAPMLPNAFVIESAVSPRRSVVACRER